MKSIQQIARELGVSRQAVYERVRSKGVKLEELTREKQGKTTVYSDDAVKIIVSCFSQEDPNCKEKTVKRKEPDRKADTIREQNQQNQDQARELEELKIALQEARRREQEARQEIERLHQIEEEQRHTISSLSETIRLNASREAVKIGAPQAERVGIIERVKRLFSR